MKLLFYSRLMEREGEQLLRLIKRMVSEEKTEIYRTIASLSNRLRQPIEDLNIAVLLTFSREDLLNILSIRELFWNLRIILILPDREDDTIAKGHILRPRFLSYLDSDFAEVAAVLGNMIGDEFSSKN